MLSFKTARIPLGRYCLSGQILRGGWNTSNYSGSGSPGDAVGEAENLGLGPIFVSIDSLRGERRHGAKDFSLQLALAGVQACMEGLAWGAANIVLYESIVIECRDSSRRPTRWSNRCLWRSSGKPGS